MEEKKIVWIPIALHDILKHKAVDEHSTIEKEVLKILEKELNNQSEGKKEILNANREKKEKRK